MGIGDGIGLVVGTDLEGAALLETDKVVSRLGKGNKKKKRKKLKV